MQHRTWISALDLQQWAPTTAAKLLMPQLLRRLVHATVDRTALERVEFPKGEQVYRPGYDGVTKTSVGNFKVPAGITNWEIGSGANTKSKLDDDYDKRVANRGAGDFSDVTYIAVSPHSYRDKADWIAAKTAASDWKEVRMYDSDDLEQWIEQAPSVGVWFARLIGKIPEGVSDLSSRWKILTGCLKKELPASVLLVGREKTAEAFQNWIASPAGLLKMVGHSPQEVVDVFTAWVETLPAEIQAPIASRCIVVDTPEGWRSLATAVNPLILVASENLEMDEMLLALVKGQGHHVLIPSVNIGSGAKNVSRMERLNRSDFGNKLVEAGVSEQEAYSFARQSGGSFTVFKRLFASDGETKGPKWGTPSSAAELAPLLLIGAWIDALTTDQSIVSKISLKTYEECVKLLNQWRKGADSPIRLTAGIWEFVSPLDAWSFLHHALNSQSLDRFEQVAVEVLSSDNPSYELPKEERWQAAVKGKTPKFSSEIRHGLAQSLALLATQPTPDEIATSVPLPERASRTIVKLLGGNFGWERWASLGAVLPLLAEAAPEVFMQAVENDLGSAAPQIPKLFDQEVSGITGRAEHTGILWSLERLAWSDVYVAKASDLLARLSRLDPGGKWANRPQASLRDIFFSWMPYTTATLDQRLFLVAGITKRYPDVGWKLLLDLLPHVSDSIGRNSPPEWNFWAEGWSAGVSDADYLKTIRELVKMARDIVGDHPEKWRDLLRSFDFLPDEEKQAVLGQLEVLDLVSFPAQERESFWKALRDRVQRYRFYPDARWAPSPEVIIRFEQIQKKFEPTDIIELVAPAFGAGFGLYGGRDLPWEEQEKLRQQNRARGISEVLQARGLPGVIQLAEKAADPWGVGLSLAEVTQEQFFAEIIPRVLVNQNEKLRRFAAGYLVWLISTKGAEWGESKISSSWTPDETSEFAICLPFNPRTWAFIKTKGEAKNAAYWKKVRPVAVRQPSEEVAEATRLLIKAKRGPSAITFLASSTYAKNVPDVPTLFDLFESALNTPFDKEDKVEEAHDFHAILEKIYAADDIDDTRLAKIEWNLLPILDRHTLLPNALHRLLAREPKFFVELLTLLFRDENASENEEALNQDEAGDETRRQNAWHLLHDFGTIPGGDASGKVVLEKLREWILAVREQARAVGRLGACDSSIGQVLAHSGEAEDGTWPILPVREIIEEVASDRLDNGFFVGVMNRRRSTWRAATEGGNQTRGVAEQWEKNAAACKIKWPRTASVLSAVANRYKLQASGEDEDAERRR